MILLYLLVSMKVRIHMDEELGLLGRVRHAILTSQFFLFPLLNLFHVSIDMYLLFGKNCACKVHHVLS
jgi:hypothetical protein